MATVAAAYPYIEIRIDTSGLVPIAQRSPGVIAIVGKTPAAAAGGKASANKPYRIDVLSDAADLFAQLDVNNNVVATPLYSSLKIALLQDPKPSKIYGVRVDGTNYAAALGSLEGADDVTFVALANEFDVGAAAGGGNPATNLTALKDHVENMSAAGSKRIGVAMIDPTRAKSANYVADAKAAVAGLKSDSSRMIMMAARGSTDDVATAAMAAIAGYDPQVSMVLKTIRGIKMPREGRYGPSEIKALSEEGINPVVQPSLLVGEALHFGEGRTFTTDASMLFIDIVRVLDDIDFRLKAGLIGTVGDARITRPGLVLVKARTEGILGPLQRSAEIDDYSIRIPVLDILSVPESTRTVTDTAIVVEARANRTVDMLVTITYGPAVHRLKVTLAPKF
jgi:hypothetical protein